MHFNARLLSTAVAVSLAVATPAFAAADQTPAAIRAKGLVNGVAATTSFRADADAFTARSVTVDGDGTEHVRLDRSYRGLRVLGGDIVVHSKNGKFKSASLSLKTKARPDVTPTLDADEATIEAGAYFDGSINTIRNKGLVIWAHGKQPALAYEVNVSGHRHSGFADKLIYVDAAKGKVIGSNDVFKTIAAASTGRSLLLGNVSLTTNAVAAKKGSKTSTTYQLQDPVRGNGNTRDGGGSLIDRVYGTAPIMTDADNVWGNNTESDVASEASDAHYGVALTWDFYKNNFGRNGIYDDGVGVKSIVNVKFCYNDACTAQGGANAGWYGSPYKFMAYGMGDSSWLPMVAIDIAGHEMTHGVTEATNGLIYSGDAGGLNEASSDIMGTMVEFYAGNANDPGDYLIGEQIFRSNPAGMYALRNMFRPGDADGNRSYNCYPAAGFAGVDPHYSSGPANHFFYLLAEGATNPARFAYTASQLVCNGDTTLAGIGRTKAQTIWYRAMDLYFTSGTTYPQARAATLSAATDLYGSGSAEYAAVARAWSAVSVN